MAGADDARMFVTGSGNEELRFAFKIPMRRRMPGATLLSPILYDLIPLFGREIAVVVHSMRLRCWVAALRGAGVSRDGMVNEPSRLKSVL